MRLTLRNIGVGTRRRTAGLGETPARYWDEEDRRVGYKAGQDTIRLYQDRQL